MLQSKQVPQQARLIYSIFLLQIRLSNIYCQCIEPIIVFCENTQGKMILHREVTVKTQGIWFSKMSENHEIYILYFKGCRMYNFLGLNQPFMLYDTCCVSLIHISIILFLHSIYGTYRNRSLILLLIVYITMH